MKCIATTSTAAHPALLLAPHPNHLHDKLRSNAVSKKQGIAHMPMQLVVQQHSQTTLYGGSAAAAANTPHTAVQHAGTRQQQAIRLQAYTQLVEELFCPPPKPNLLPPHPTPFPNICIAGFTAALLL
jgi:hypothetical protein